MKAVKWGAVSALIFVGMWTVAHLVNSPMPPHFAEMQPMGLVGAGFFWGAVLCMIRDRLGVRNG